MKLRVLVAAALAMTMTTAPVLAADMAEDAMMGDPMATECYEKANMETDTAMKDMKMAECQEMYPTPDGRRVMTTTP